MLQLDTFIFGTFIAIGVLSGKYEDDFENTITVTETDVASSKIDVASSKIEVASSKIEVASSKTEMASDDETAANETANVVRNERDNECSDPLEDGLSYFEHSFGDEDTLTVSFEDIGVLRRSLERDEFIRESLASTRTLPRENVRKCSFY